MRRYSPWEQYLVRLCLDRWSLDPAATLQIIAHIESLVVPGAASDSSVATVLRRAGVAVEEAHLVAPKICRAMGVRQRVQQVGSAA